MSLLLDARDVPVASPTTASGMEISSPSSSAADGFLAFGAGRVVDQRNSLGLRTDDASSESSSIGVPEDDSDDERETGGDEEEVQSALSLGALEDSLPIKRGLSNYYAGRSKSFVNLADVKSVKEMAKEENPFNKRRRTLLAYKLSSSPSKRRMMMMKKSKDRSSFYGHGNPISMPLLPVDEHDDDGDDATGANGVGERREDDDSDDAAVNRRSHNEKRPDFGK